MTPPRLRFSLLVLCIGLATWFSAALGFNAEQIRQSFLSRYGNVVSGEIFNDWLRIMKDARNVSEPEKVQRINRFFNTEIAFEEDYSLWDKPEYWATPLETLARGRGDCEDYAIAKYFSLLELGVSINKLRLVYVQASLPDIDGSSIKQGHMVLAYYPSPDAEPQILDNLNKKILPASLRPDLLPVFSFNSAGLWQGTGKNVRRNSFSRWQDLLNRSRAEGFQ